MNKSNGNSRNCYQANDFRSRRRIIAPYIRLPALYSGFHSSNNENNSQCRQQQQAEESSSSLSLSAIITQALAVMEHHQSCSEIEIPTENNNTIPLNT